MGFIELASKIATNEQAQHLISRFIPLEKYSHYQRDYEWELMIPFFMGAIPGFVICKYCQDIKFGEYDISELTRMRMGAKEAFYPGLLTVNPITVTFIAPVPNMVGTFLHNWKRKIVDDKGYYYPKNNYKRTIYVFMYDTTGVRASRIKMKGVFPKSYPAYNLSYGGTNVVRFDVIFSVDRIESEGLGIDLAGAAAQVGLHV